jgi:hypothetical protein
MKKGELVTLRAAQCVAFVLSTAFLLATVYAIIQVSIGNVHPGTAGEA